ncbi:unnamed protein product, partial [Rangifer tarandus platyrhynchus]
SYTKVPFYLSPPFMLVTLSSSPLSLGLHGREHSVPQNVATDRCLPSLSSSPSPPACHP